MTKASISAPDLKAWITRVLVRVSVPEEEAAVATDVLVDTSLRGVDTHGVLLLPYYVQSLRSGAIDPRPQIRVERTGPATATVDGDNGLGHVVGVRAMREAIELARKSGLGAVAVRSSNHFGAAGYYARLATPEGMLGLALTNSSPGQAPWGAGEAFLGTNPLAFAAPGGIEGGFALDMATTQVAYGKVSLAARLGERIPIGWAVDKEGRPTEDPQAALEGRMLPLGGYKGYGLALMVEILTGILTGAGFGPHVSEPGEHKENVGHFFLALDVGRFMPLEEFRGRMKQMADEIHALPLAEGFERDPSGARFPGEIELEAAERRGREGIPLPGFLVSELEKVGEEVGEVFDFRVNELPADGTRKSG